MATKTKKTKKSKSKTKSKPRVCAACGGRVTSKFPGRPTLMAGVEVHRFGCPNEAQRLALKLRELSEKYEERATTKDLKLLLACVDNEVVPFLERK